MSPCFDLVFCLSLCRAARAFGEYLSHTHPENRNGSGWVHFTSCSTTICPHIFVLHFVVTYLSVSVFVVGEALSFRLNVSSTSDHSPSQHWIDHCILLAPVALTGHNKNLVFLFSLFLLSLISDHLLSDTFIGQETDSPDISRLNNNNSLQPYSQHTLIVKPSQEEVQPGSQSAPLPTSSKRRLSVERSLSSEDQQNQRRVESSVKPARVYTITRERDMLGGQGSEESLELEVLKRTSEPSQINAPPGLRGSHHRGSQHRGNNDPTHQHHYGHAPMAQPLQSSGSTHNIRDWGSRRSRSREDCTPDCVACIRPHCQSQRSLDLETSPQGGGKQHKKLERMYSEDRVSSEDRGKKNISRFCGEFTLKFTQCLRPLLRLS